MSFFDISLSVLQMRVCQVVVWWYFVGSGVGCYIMGWIYALPHGPDVYCRIIEADDACIGQCFVYFNSINCFILICHLSVGYVGRLLCSSGQCTLIMVDVGC